ncbi:MULTISPECIES: dienelactone hydrolase family protein [unclassified Legionella]|uniref:dienelactone hydrolase family protein n=1 Tax=unclassified Legionella TaxID=2622702 RepID=UPI0010546F35|nr:MULTISPECIES: alpha/beta hydrolase [unclassified Legionella]MDI9818382.1 alpha/beta hydrolase [Legionella sp. PL877]
MTFSYNKEHTVSIPSDNVHLDGFLYLPPNTAGLVLFAHGSGSSRLSKRNQFVAKELNKASLATLLFDLLTPKEEAIDLYTAEFRFNINFLASRLIDTTLWCLNQTPIEKLPIGYFGSSTGGGAALVAAAQKANLIKAVVSRGGRPDLAGAYLPSVKAPTLMIVGGDDELVIKMNESALSKMTCVKKLEIVPGASHLFEEPGTLDKVARLAKTWFVHYFSSSQEVDKK